MSQNFIPIDMSVPVRAHNLKRGEIAFCADSTYPVMRAEGPTGVAVLIELGGDDFLRMWEAADREESAYVIDGCRLEIDPTSIMEGYFKTPVAGLAFCTQSKSGIFAFWAGNIGRNVVVPALIGSDDINMVADDVRAFFSKWRIVSGPIEKPFVWVNSRDATTAS